MGWASGSELFSDVWMSVRAHIPAPNRVGVCKKVMEVFEDKDCDTLDECIGQYPEIAKAYKSLHPDFGNDA